MFYREHNASFPLQWSSIVVFLVHVRYCYHDISWTYTVDKTDREYSLAPTDALIRFCR